MSKLKAIWLLLISKKYILHSSHGDLISYSRNITVGDIRDTADVLYGIYDTCVQMEINEQTTKELLSSIEPN